MMKSLSEFICQNCGAKSQGYLGRCPQCGAWNSYVETPTEVLPEAKFRTKEKAQLLKLDGIAGKLPKRISTSISEVDRVLGGGIVPASVILIAGEPGIGKSTLLTQIASGVAQDKLKVIYVTGEESPEQVKIRTHRIMGKRPNSFWLAAETDIEKIINSLIDAKPNLVILDSIQTVTWSGLSGTAGSVGQVKECARILSQTAKAAGFTLILVGHVTKEGVIAGPKILEHLVDVVLEFSGDTQHNFRILRSAKNRFGAVAEVGVFEMTEAGLTEVENPSKFFLSKRTLDVTGSAVFATVSGTRTMLCEIQALVQPTNFVQPKRVVNGLDAGRVAQLLAVISKIFKIPVRDFDLFVNVAGGLQITEPAADLPTSLSILSVFWDKPLGKMASAAEVGLLGELREVGQIERRKVEAVKFGFSNFLGPDFGNLTKAVQVAFAQN